MIFGVDGTGPYFDGNYLGGLLGGYKDGMKLSFVTQICGLVGDAWQPHVLDAERGREYWRGPDNTSLLAAPSPKEVAEEAAKAHRNGKKVFLTGYSRGAAIVIDAATILSEKNPAVPVEAMFLFDAVNKLSTLNAEVIPGNVHHCYHAVRHPNSGSRNSFGNCGLKAVNMKTFKLKVFMSTHGGLGSSPWGKKGLVPAGPMGVAELIQSAARANAGRGGTIITPRQMAAAMVHDEPHKYADKIYEGVPDSAFTNVTPDQELAGMIAVQVWMWKRLALHGLGGIPSFTQPRPHAQSK